MTGLSVVRWRRYGKDRPYVSGSDGTKVGWVDVVTGSRKLDDPRYADSFGIAVDAWYHNNRTAPSPTESDLLLTAHVPQPRGDDPRRWHDLSTHRPGQAAKARASEELAAMRGRTRVGAFLARAMDMKTDERAWRVGAAGEETVGARLEKLTDRGWHVLHAVPVGTRGSDIDHVLIGPGGVYTINTKSHPGKKVWVSSRAILVSGQSVPYLRNSRYGAQRAERLLSKAVGWPVPVRPVLVFLTGSLVPNVTIKSMPDDVLVLDRMDIPGAFKRAPQSISAQSIDELLGAARRCTTWAETLSCSCPGRPAR